MTEAEAILAAGVLATIASLISVIASLRTTRKQLAIAKAIETTRQEFETKLLSTKTELEERSQKEVKAYEEGLQRERDAINDAANRKLKEFEFSLQQKLSAYQSTLQHFEEERVRRSQLLFSVVAEAHAPMRQVFDIFILMLNNRSAHRPEEVLVDFSNAVAAFNQYRLYKQRLEPLIRPRDKAFLERCDQLLIRVLLSMNFVEPTNTDPKQSRQASEYLRRLNADRSVVSAKIRRILQGRVQGKARQNGDAS